MTTPGAARVACAWMRRRMGPRAARQTGRRIFTLPVAALGGAYLGGTRLRDLVIATGADQRAGCAGRCRRAAAHGRRAVVLNVLLGPIAR